MSKLKIQGIEIESEADIESVVLNISYKDRPESDDTSDESNSNQNNKPGNSGSRPAAPFQTTY